MGIQLLKEKNIDTITDIDLKALPETKLQALAASNTQFISIIAHDLRGPFGTVIGLLSLLNLNFKNGKMDETQEFLDRASDSARRAMHLLDELTCWATSQNQGMSFNPTRVNLYDLLTEEVEAVRASARQKKINIKYNINSDLIAIADGEMVKTIVRNLIANAVKFTPDEGNITISAKNKGIAVVVSVKDSGVGVGETVKDQLFDNNVLYSTYGTNNEKGTGLGLKICKQFVDIHGGKIKLNSTPGKGSEFKFSLPYRHIVYA